MDTIKNKESYLQRKAQQMQQWERIRENLTARANKTEDK